MTINDSDTVDIETPTGVMRTLISRPTVPGRYPGLVLYSEIFQITAPIRRTAAILSGHGFVVATPEVYHEFEPAGTVLAYDEAGAARGNELKTTKPVSAFDSDTQSIVEFLSAYEHCTGKLGAVGVCLGGHLAFRAAMNPAVRATACFYATDIHKRSLGLGMDDDSLYRIKDINGELLMIWGRQDPHVPREGRTIIYNALADADRNFQWLEFNGAHAFMRDEGPRYDPLLAKTCYGIVVDAFKRTLADGATA